MRRRRLDTHARTVRSHILCRHTPSKTHTPIKILTPNKVLQNLSSPTAWFEAMHSEEAPNIRIGRRIITTLIIATSIITVLGQRCADSRMIREARHLRAGPLAIGGAVMALSLLVGAAADTPPALEA